MNYYGLPDNFFPMTDGKRIAIVGSRDYKPLKDVVEFVEQLPWRTVVISGGARGVDTTAEEAAKKRRLDTHIFYANWNKHGRGAGMIRNRKIVESSDIIVAFWDGISRGTKHTIEYANSKGKPVKVFINGKEAKPDIV
jgi:predicted Rossmann fold nucleotide-binding protein DprA/Smf involved in DNA uptake